MDLAGKTKGRQCFKKIEETASQFINAAICLPLYLLII
jgi:hypothetical protein